jgi:hypothetical protein
MSGDAVTSNVTKTYRYLFPESGWTLRLSKHHNRVRVALYWSDKDVPTHVTDVPIDDIEDLLGY